MKKCPDCQKNFNFVTFLWRCGSDTLIADPREASSTHRREHRCDHCHHVFWIEYPPQEMRHTAQKTLPVLTLIAVAGFWAGKLFLHLGMPQTFILVLFLLLVALPVDRAWVKYESAQLKTQ